MSEILYEGMTKEQVESYIVTAKECVKREQKIVATINSRGELYDGELNIAESDVKSYEKMVSLLERMLEKF